MSPSPGDAVVISFGVWCWTRVFAAEVLGQDLSKTRLGEAAIVVGVVLTWNVARQIVVGG